MEPESGPKHLEQGNSSYTTVLIVHGKEERITGTFREIQMLNVIYSAGKNGERASEKDLRDLSGSQLYQDLRLLRKNLNSHGSEIITLGKRGAREFSLGEIPEQPTESFLAFRKSAKRQQPLKNISSDGKVNEIPKMSVLPEGEKNRQIAKMETNLAHMAISRLMKSSRLKESDRSPFELLKKVAPEGTTLESLQGIWTHGDLVEYIIECITKTVETIRKTGNSASLSKKEQQISDNLYLLSEQGYNQQKIERVIRIIFSIPPPASVPTPAAARAN